MNRILNKTESFLFARWIATCYADEHLDSSMKDQHTYGFNEMDSMSVLNRESGIWWKKQLEHFYAIVLPNYKKNGSFKNTRDFLQL